MISATAPNDSQKPAASTAQGSSAEHDQQRQREDVERRANAVPPITRLPPPRACTRCAARARPNPRARIQQGNRQPRGGRGLLRREHEREPRAARRHDQSTAAKASAETMVMCKPEMLIR